MKGKCTLNEQANLAAQVVAAKQRSIFQYSSGPAKDSRAKTKGNGSGTATKKGNIDATTNKAPTEPCPVCERKFYNRTGVARHLNEKTTGALCMERLKNDPVIQARVLILARPDDPPAQGEWRVRCPWCASHYEHPNGVRAHMMSHHPDLYNNVVWVHKEAFPNATELVWAEKKVLEAEGRAVHFLGSDVEMRTADEPKSDYGSSDDEALFVLTRTNRSGNRSSTPKSSQRDDPPLAPAAEETKPNVADKIDGQNSSAGAPTPPPTQQSTTAQAPVSTTTVEQQPTAKPHICPWCNTCLAAADEFKRHLLKCIGPFAPALQQQDTRPIIMMGSTTNNNMWKCPWCPAYFTAKRDVEAHISTMHAEQPVQVILHWVLDWKVKTKCPCCLFSFVGEKMVKTHLAEQHGGQRVVWPSEEKQPVSAVLNGVANTDTLAINDEEEDKKIVVGCSKDLPIILEDEDGEEMDTDTNHGDSPPIPTLPAASAAPTTPAQQQDEPPVPAAVIESDQDVAMAQDEPDQDAVHGQQAALSQEVSETDSQQSAPTEVIPALAPPVADRPGQTPFPAAAPQVTLSTVSDVIAMADAELDPPTTTQAVPIPASIVAGRMTPAPIPVSGSSPWQAIAIDESASTPTSVATRIEPAQSTSGQVPKPELVRQCVRMGCREPPLPGMLMCAACDAVYGDEEW
ncbi:hypothetical protein GE09DRAFT_1289886 [Coniochaeta sp. 2T2.1]|nr:hypothetical protein GE09DRAFT_1289886 [Coniochaeta sp. 2T2.1]